MCSECLGAQGGESKTRRRIHGGGFQCVSSTSTVTKLVKFYRPFTASQKGVKLGVNRIACPMRTMLKTP